jgi:hypothetical protein
MVFGKKCFMYSNGLMDHLCPRVNGDPPLLTALHTAEEICNCKWYNRPKYFNGTLDAFVKIARVGGIHGVTQNIQMVPGWYRTIMRTVPYRTGNW